MAIKSAEPDVCIRQARIADAPVLVAAEKATAQTPGLLISRPNELTLEAFERMITELSKTGRYIVAEKIGQIVAHAFLEPMPLEAISHVFRLTIVVHPGHLSQGIGTALMRDLMEWAKHTPRVGKIELLTRATNERAIRLYSKLRFVEEGRFKNRVRLTDGKLVDDIAMAWFPKN
jgi:RimJ/RimL family protein N-acetyltransferase